MSAQTGQKAGVPRNSLQLLSQIRQYERELRKLQAEFDGTADDDDDDDDVVDDDAAAEAASQPPRNSLQLLSLIRQKERELRKLKAELHGTADDDDDDVVDDYDYVDADVHGDSFVEEEVSRAGEPGM